MSGRKRKQEEQSSSGTEKKPHAVGAGDHKSFVDSRPLSGGLPNRLNHLPHIEMEDDGNTEFQQALAASLKQVSSSSSSSSKLPENKLLDVDEMDQSSDSAKDAQFKERLLLFVAAAVSNDTTYLAKALKQSSLEEKITLISTPAPSGENEYLTALEAASGQGHRESVNTMLNSLPLKQAEEVVAAVWEKIAHHIAELDKNDKENHNYWKAYFADEYSNWQKLCVDYLKNRKKEALGKGASSSSSSSQPAAPAIATREDLIVSAIFDNEFKSFEAWCNPLTLQDKLKFINTPLIAIEGATILETAINYACKEIVAALLKGLPTKEKEQILGKINLPGSDLLKELCEQLSREKTAESKSSGNGSNSDTPSTDTTSDKSEKKERSGKEECDPDEIPSATTATPPPIRPNTYWEEEEKSRREEDKEREKESEINSHFIKSMNQLCEAVNRGNLGNVCSILLNASISGADKTTIFTPLEFLTSDDLLRLYHLFVDTSATFKTVSISVTDLEDYIVLKLQERGKSTVEAYAMLSSPRPNNGIVSSPLSNSSASSLGGGPTPDQVTSDVDLLFGTGVSALPIVDWNSNPSGFWYNDPSASITDMPTPTSSSSSSSQPGGNPGNSNNNPSGPGTS